LAAAALTALGVGLVAQTATQKQGGAVAPGDWQTINRDLAATRYSPLNQINTGNVAKLAAAWSFPVAGAGSAVPLVVNGVMYVPNGGRVTAIDGETGKELWSFTLATLTSAPPAPADAAPPAAAPAPAAPGAPAGAPGAGGQGRGGRQGAAPGGGRGGRGGGGPQVSQRGLGYWPGDGKLGPRILFLAGARLWAIDAATGQPAAGFGENGSTPIGQNAGGVPTIYRNVAIIGASSTEDPTGNAPGNPRAFDVVTGKKLWEFRTAPQRGERFAETWGNGSERRVMVDGKEVIEVRNGTNMWGFAAPIDVERGIAYLPIAGPAANYYGGDRPGANLFGNSIVAVDVQTGQYRWHFQTVHHDLWDIDLPSAGALIDVVQDGRRSPAIAHVGKSSYFFVLNRQDGNPLIKVEERPVPRGDVPGEYYHPTQPFPVKPEPLSPTSFNAERDLVRPEDTTPEHAAACKELMERSGGFINLGPFTPFMFKADGAPPRSTIQLPGGTGGVNWGGVAADPTTGIVYANAQTGSLTGWVEKVPMEVDPVTGARRPTIEYPDSFGSDQEYNRAFVPPPGATGPTAGKGPFSSFSALGMPCMRPPWGQLVAVNANTGDIVWRAVLGIRPKLPEGKQLVGNSGSAGPTVTAGGLVFVGATNDGRFRAFDAKSGKQVWEATLTGNANANPMTYTGRNGKQFVAVIAGNRVNVFALP
jgi:quinoprotein glucose dehydrogenase